MAAPSAERSPLAVARVLASRYGHKLDPVIYTQGVAVSGRLRLHQLDPASPDPAPSIAALVEPHVSGAKPMFAPTAGGAELAGLAWAEELFEAAGDVRHKAVLVAAADRFAPRSEGGPPVPCDSDFRVEDFFFAAAVLGRAYGLTGNVRYADMLVAFLTVAPNQRDDGLFWHAASAPWCWGRGNGFAAMGFSEALTYLPRDHPALEALIARHRRHMAGLAAHQAPSGMFRQVIDVADSYEELSATCMIAYAAARGLRGAWLDGALAPLAERAWQAATSFIGANGSVTAVCVGTGVQPDLQSYLERPAVSGFDDRGGAMALWCATEMAALKRGLPLRPSPAGRGSL